MPGVDDNPTTAGQTSTFTFQQGTTVVAERNQTVVQLSRWQFLWVCNQLMSRNSAPKAEVCLAWLGIAAAFLFPIVTAEFKVALGVGKETWETFALWGFIGSTLRFLYLLWQVLKYWFSSKDETAEKFVDRLIRELQGHPDTNQT